LKMVHRDIAAADLPLPTSPRGPVEQGSPGDSITVGRILPGGLRVLDSLGSTPEGPLYRAEYLTGVEVALVVLRPEADGSETSRRERIDQAMQIQHPNVAAVCDVGEVEDGSVYVVLEQLAGESLSTLLAAGHVFELPEAVDLVLQAAAGLEAAHRAGFVHGHLSPHTIVVRPAAYRRSEVKLIGFTLDPAFRQRGPKPPIPDEVSAGYASPERLVGHPPDERSDVYSLVAVLHHLLTGMPPGPGQVDRSLPKVARLVLETGLAPAPARRFQTIPELDEALKRLAAVAANPRKAMLRRGLLIGTVGAGLALVTGGVWLLAGSRWTATSEERAVPVSGTMDLGVAEPELPATREAPPAPAPARSRVPSPAAAGQDARRTRNSPADSDRSPAGASADQAPRAARPRSAPAALVDAGSDRPIETGMVPIPPPEEPSSEELPPPTMEERAEVYLRIGLDEASRQLGRPVHAIEGLTPSFLGLARSRFPGYTSAGPAIRVVYVGPDGNLILLDQQRIPPGRSAPPATPTRWRIGDVMLYLHGEVRPEALGSFARRVR